jgi:hypothetical protein
MAVDGNKQYVHFGVDGSGNKQELTVDSVNGYLIVSVMSNGSAGVGTKQIDDNNTTTAFAVDDAVGLITTLITNADGRLHVDTSGLTVS